MPQNDAYGKGYSDHGEISSSSRTAWLVSDHSEAMARMFVRRISLPPTSVDQWVP